MTTDIADLVSRLRDFEGSDELGDGDFSVCEEAATALETANRRIEELEGLVHESLYHLRLDARAEAYHKRALSALPDLQPKEQQP